MRRHVIALSALLCAVGTACSDGEAEARRLAGEPLKQGDKYVCQVLPQSVFRPLLAAPNPQFDEKLRGDLIEQEGGCSVVVEDPEATDDWVTADVSAATGNVAYMARGRDLDLVRDKNYVADYFTWLPEVLGYGGVHRAPQSSDYVVWSLFKCGQEDRTLRISIDGASPDREDPVDDAITLMRFAQQRYAELANCTVRPPSSTTPPTTDG